MESEALVTATLPDGGTIRYDISLSRDFSHIPGIIAWKVNGIEFAFPSTQNSLSSSGSEVTDAETEDAATADTAATDEAAAGDQKADEAAADDKKADEAAATAEAEAEAEDEA